MKKVIIAPGNRDLRILMDENFTAGKGTYRVITKCKEGFMI